MDTQNKFISDELIRYTGCQIKDKHLYNLKEVCTSCLSMILNQNFINPIDMKAFFCLFDTLFLQTSKRKENGIYVLTKNIRHYIKNIKLMSFNNVEGYIYLADFFSPDIQAIIKFQKKDSDIPYTIQEYYIGINILNKLRYLIPTFVYTLGAFYCPKTIGANKRPIKNPLSVLCDDTTGKNTAFIVYEKIPGESVKTFLKKDKLNFKQFLSIFIQLLLGLEVAQREARFTHFDLHSDNVMIRENDVDTTYNVHLDMTTYNVVNPEFIPVIIDFGAATCFIENRYIGSYDYIKHGMLNFMVPGHDMYKFLVYCGYEAEPLIKQNIRSLFRFYGDNDPYNIVMDEKGFITSKNEYCKKITFSQAATYTPLIFIEWLLKEYSLESDILVSNRVHYLPIQYSSLIKEYDKIFKYTNDGIEHVIESIKKCIISTSSYVMTKYNINLLDRYNDNLQSDELSRKIKDMNKYLDKFEDKFIDIDNAMLENVFNIKIPTRKDLEMCFIKLLTIQIPNPIYDIDEKTKLHIEDTIKELDVLLSYEYELRPYLQFYFTILEMNLENKFFDWIKNFTKSDIYKFYSLNVLNTQRAKRWGQSLSAYDNENTILESPIFQENQAK